jgi:hypothetical protein
MARKPLDFHSDNVDELEWNRWVQLCVLGHAPWCSAPASTLRAGVSGALQRSCAMPNTPDSALSNPMHHGDHLEAGSQHRPSDYRSLEAR